MYTGSQRSSSLRPARAKPRALRQRSARFYPATNDYYADAALTRCSAEDAHSRRERMRMAREPRRTPLNTRVSVQNPLVSSTRSGLCVITKVRPPDGACLIERKVPRADSRVAMMPRQIGTERLEGAAPHSYVSEVVYRDPRDCPDYTFEARGCRQRTLVPQLTEVVSTWC